MNWLQKDPLAKLRIKYKLPLSFVMVSLIAFGLGGFLIIKSVHASLSREIQTRLKSETVAQASVFDQHLLLLGRRSQDFASDGFIRTQTELLETDPQTESKTKERLINHLLINKLPIVEEFSNLLVFDNNSNLLVSVFPSDDRLRRMLSAGLGQDTLWYSPLFQSAAGNNEPQFAIVTPLINIHQTQHIGYLVCVVDFRSVINYISGQYQKAMSFSDVEKYLSFIDQTGSVLDIPWWTLNERENVALIDLNLKRPTEGYAPGANSHEGRHICRDGEDMFGYSFPLKYVNWTILVELGTSSALKTISVLEEKLFFVGLLIALLILIAMYFPVRFLIQPLSELETMAFNIKEGDYSARVVTDSEDEIGDLATSFNQMAEALEERTRVLKKTAADLTEREKVIRIQHDRLKAVVNSMNDGLILLNSAGEIVLHNQAGEPLIAYLNSPDKQLEKFECKHPEKSTARECVNCLMDISSMQDCTVKMEERFFEILATKLPAMSGGAGKILVARDITERTLMHDKHARQERLAVLGNMAAVVAHEMNSPLAAISMYNQMMMDEFDQDSQFTEHVDVIRRNTETCREIITNLLDFARTPTLNISKVDIHEVINQTIRLLVPLHEKANIAVKLYLDAEQAEIEGDLSRLKQIFANIILNAIQAVKEIGGQVRIRTSNDDDRQMIVIDVEDTGPGIDPAIVKDIFNPFFTTRGSDMGTGLGLSTGKRIAEAHGGSVILLQNRPRFTVFRIVLPFRYQGGGEFGHHSPGEKGALR
ncbi:MAG: HAMP domain-containing protein [FCB group bacterium]|nr:HAMP domain-containing protein [FCB group bacterium]